MTSTPQRRVWIVTSSEKEKYERGPFLGLGLDSLSQPVLLCFCLTGVFLTKTILLGEISQIVDFLESGGILSFFLVTFFISPPLPEILYFNFDDNL